jgi:hypothetical protein
MDDTRLLLIQNFDWDTIVDCSFPTSRAIHDRLRVTQISHRRLTLLPPRFRSLVDILPIDFPIQDALREIGVFVAGNILSTLGFKCLQLNSEKLEL